MNSRTKKQMEQLQGAPAGIRCRIYALRARGFVNRIFELSEPEEGEAVSVRRIFKCRYGFDKSVESIAAISGVAAEMFRDIPWIYCATDDNDYFEAFRRVGIPIADYDEFKACMKGDEDEKEI